jgi:hypothetical protein
MRGPILAVACLLLTAAPLAAAELKPERIAGRWTGETLGMTRGVPITLDIVACGNAWCGVKVEAGDKCGGTALKVDFVGPLGDPQSDDLLFDGTLELAPGTEPYTVHAWLLSANEKHPLMIQMRGDTGGVYREYRRSFPFEARLVRVKDAVCHAPATVSSLDRR